MFDVLIVGGGAAGFYAALHMARTDQTLKIAILEKGKQVLSKVKVSGGGRCNLTHAEYDPREFVKNYPRGQKELLGPFHIHGAAQTIGFFQAEGLALKTEDDGRIFPVSDNSQTVIDFFTSQLDQLGVSVLKHNAVTQISKEGSHWQVTSLRSSYNAKNLLITSGSGHKVWQMIQDLGHVVTPPVPSLFTFHIQDPKISGIPGVSARARVRLTAQAHGGKKVTIALKSKKETDDRLMAEGPVLITHWGLSGPAILRLSAWGARIMNEMDYKFQIVVNWVPDHYEAAILPLLMEVKEVEARKTVARTPVAKIPKRLWANLVRASDIPKDMRWADVPKQKLVILAGMLTNSRFRVNGKSSFKEEFVTAGGVSLKEIDFRTFGSKVHPNLYFAGEVLDIDAVTGGFNFQNAWTGAYIAAMAICERA